jgi:hypothetical protein
MASLRPVSPPSRFALSASLTNGALAVAAALRTAAGACSAGSGQNLGVFG